MRRWYCEIFLAFNCIGLYSVAVVNSSVIVVDQPTAKKTVAKVQRQQAIEMWGGGIFATVGLIAILAAARAVDWNNVNTISLIMGPAFAIWFGATTCWTNHRLLKNTSRARLFLAQPCRSTVHMKVLTVQLQQLTVEVPLKGKIATTLAKTVLPTPQS